MANTLVTISDNKVGVSTDTDNTADFYQATVLSATDYYAFGMSMSGRSWQSDSYRYGFNGKEKSEGDDFYDFEARSYYEKIGRFTSVDAKFKVFPNVSPYVYALNNPIILIDDDGNLPILPLLIYIGKNFGEGAITDVVIQMVGAYLFGDAQNISEAWAEVNLEQAAWAGAENLIKNKHAEAIKEGAVAVVDYMRNTDDPTAIGATKVFLIGGGASYLGDWIAKKGLEKVAKGLKKLGLSEHAINKYLNVEGSTRIGTKEEVSAARNKIAKQRGKSNTAGNYGYLEGEVDGLDKLDGKNMWRSVSVTTAKQDVGKYNIFTATHVGESNRLADTDSEYRMLSDLAIKIKTAYGDNYANATGTIKIVSEKNYCSSCQGVIQQFQKMFPKINIIQIQVGEKVAPKRKGG
ncbi:MAG: hypothetical protein MUE81_13460 [Thermoflexibacter sp.]|nr:hypothetical protein [Thermoflexibacter sp.]